MLLHFIRETEKEEKVRSPGTTLLSVRHLCAGVWGRFPAGEDGSSPACSMIRGTSWTGPIRTGPECGLLVEKLTFSLSDQASLVLLTIQLGI